MMTIKEFAALCGCSTQTLRYYDKIDLLKPAKVDPWSGYRHYDAEQAVSFVKIKNLQAADFSIDEIKQLLTKSDEEIYDAFNAKIAVQKQKLARIIEIQKSYLKEKTDMEKIIQEMSGFILNQLHNFDGLREFGLTPEDGPAVAKAIRSYMEHQMRQHITNPQDLTLTVNEEVIQGADQISEKIHSLTADNMDDTILLNDSEDDGDFSPEQYDSIWEVHGWAYVYEFFDQIPTLEEAGEYCFLFRLAPDESRNDIAFSLFMLGAMILKREITAVPMGCTVESSEDSQNHFVLLRKK